MVDHVNRSATPFERRGTFIGAARQSRESVDCGDRRRDGEGGFRGAVAGLGLAVPEFREHDCAPGSASMMEVEAGGPQRDPHGDHEEKDSR
jgi:hypothetical protein